MSDIRIYASLIRILKKHHGCISLIRNRVLIYFTSGLGSNMYPIKKKIVLNESDKIVNDQKKRDKKKNNNNPQNTTQKI